jgi:thioredoxin 2
VTVLSQVACPHCATANRVAAGRESRAAKCGKCGAALFDGTPIEVDDAGFERHLKATHGPVLVDVWAPWCGPCRAMAPNFAAVAQNLATQVRFLKLNADDNQSPARLGVRSIPALVLFDRGAEIARHAGLMTAAQLSAWLAHSLAARAA